MNKIMAFFLKGSLYTSLFSTPPVIMYSKTVLVHAHQTKSIVIRSVDQSKRWVMFDTSFIIDLFDGRLRINGRPLSTDNIIMLNGDDYLISANGVCFKSMVHIAVQQNTLVFTGLVDKNQINNYSSYYLVEMQKHVDDFLHKLDSSMTDQLIVRKHQESIKVVKVLLATAAVNNQSTTQWILKSDKKMRLHKQGYEANIINTQQVSIVVGHNRILINGAVMKSSFIYIEPDQDYIHFNDKKYKGGFVIIKDSHNVLLINAVDLEDYIYAVVRSESWPGWPLEVNKVFAISCRSYAVSLMKKAEHINKVYHIRDTNVHQRYNLYGEHHDTTVRKAVESTKGICLTYKNNPVLAMFDSCCGGIIPAHTKAFNFTEDTVYLARQYPCTFCKKTSLYSWQVTYEIAAFEKMIADRALHALPVKKVRIHSADKAGIVQEVLVEGHKRSIKLSAKWLSAVAKEIKSCFFSVELCGKKLVFKGNGLGHLVGLCQWGAWQMVKEGWDYKSILHYYYPSTVLKKLF